MKVFLSGINISHIVTGLPKKVVNVEEYEEEFGAKNVRRISKSTGIRQMHVADDSLCASDYDVMLAEYLMKQTGVKGEDFDGIIFVSQSPDYIMPATSIVMQGRLGLPQTAVAFDLNFGCPGFVYGLYQAALLVSSGSCNRVLLFNGDTKVRMTHPKDRSTRLIMGDGFSLTVVEKGSQSIGVNLNLDGKRYEAAIIKKGGFRNHDNAYVRNESEIGDIEDMSEYMHMDGVSIMDFTLNNVPEMINDTLEFIGWKKEEIGTYAMHQANRKILESIAYGLGISMENVPLGLQNMGNTASSSVPLTLAMNHHELQAKKLLSKVLICGFGTGLAWGSVAADLSNTKIWDVLEL